MERLEAEAHAMEDHLLDQIIEFEGIGDFGKDFVEQSHQDGIREEAHTKAIRNRAFAADLHSQLEHKRLLSMIKVKQEDVRKVASWKQTSSDGIKVPVKSDSKKRK